MTETTLPPAYKYQEGSEKTVVINGRRAIYKVMGGEWVRNDPSGTPELSNELAFIGDSMLELGWNDYYRTASTSDAKGLVMSLFGCGVGITADAAGTLEFRASDSSLRWTAPSDTAGAWTTATIGYMTLQSGTAEKWLKLAIRSLTFPATDQTVTVDVAGSLYKTLTWNMGLSTEILSQLRANDRVTRLAARSTTTAQAVEALPWYEQEAGGYGVDVISIGNNELTGSATAAEILADAETLFDARLSIGRKIVIVGSPARWGTGYPTAMTADELAKFITINQGLRDYAAANQTNCRYVDLYSVTRDPAYINGQGLARDPVDKEHFDAREVSLCGPIIAAAIRELGFVDGDYPMAGDAGVVATAGWMTGTAGTIGTGASGTAPSNWTVSRSSGSDLTIVSSIVGYSDGHQGKMTQLELTSTTASNVARLTTSGFSLASLGYAVGDEVYFDVDVTVVSGNATSVIAYLNFTGASTIVARIVFPVSKAGTFHGRSPTIKIPTGTTSIALRVDTTMPASSTETVRVGEFIMRAV